MHALAVASLLLAATAASPQVTVAVSPQPAYIAADADDQFLNFDLILDNPTGEPLDLDKIELTVSDATGAVVLRKFLDGNGTRPSIRTADVTNVPAGGQAMVFNPFHQFDAGVDLHSLHYRMHLSSADGKRVHVAETTLQPSKYQNRARLVLPLEKRLLVWDGHDFYAHHRRWDYTIPGLQQLGFRTNFMRYSYDFVRVDHAGNMSSGPEEKNESWYGFGQPVRAVADGMVVAVKDDQPDDRKFDASTIAKDGPMKIFGNYVVIDHGNGEFGLYGHIQQGSSKVSVGERVKQKQTVAAVGASGSSMFPHLHFELQTGPDTNSEGLPSTFVDFDRIRGAKVVPVKTGLVNSGEIVRSR